MADQESRGVNGDPGAGENGWVMWMNLAEGLRAVNGERLGLFCLSGLSRVVKQQNELDTRPISK